MLPHFDAHAVGATNQEISQFHVLILLRDARESFLDCLNSYNA